MERDASNFLRICVAPWGKGRVGWDEWRTREVDPERADFWAFVAPSCQCSDVFAETTIHSQNWAVLFHPWHPWSGFTLCSRLSNGSKDPEQIPLTLLVAESFIRIMVVPSAAIDSMQQSSEKPCHLRLLMNSLQSIPKHGRCVSGIKLSVQATGHKIKYIPGSLSEYWRYCWLHSSYADTSVLEHLPESKDGTAMVSLLSWRCLDAVSFGHLDIVIVVKQTRNVPTHQLNQQPSHRIMFLADLALKQNWPCDCVVLTCRSFRASSQRTRRDSLLSSQSQKATARRRDKRVL